MDERVEQASSLQSQLQNRIEHLGLTTVWVRSAHNVKELEMLDADFDRRAGSKEVKKSADGRPETR